MKNNLIALKQNYVHFKPAILARLNDFKTIKKQDLFYEAAFCILTPQSNAKRCWQAIEELKKINFQEKNINPVLYLKKQTRFHNNKAISLINLRNNWEYISNRINNSKNSKELRDFLVKNVRGYGYKEASHFLRNIGHDNLAILDRHILKNLHKFEAIPQIPKTIPKSKYFEIENKFQDFSNNVRIPMDHLDLMFWAQETGEIFK